MELEILYLNLLIVLLLFLFKKINVIVYLIVFWISIAGNVFFKETYLRLGVSSFLIFFSYLCLRIFHKNKINYISYESKAKLTFLFLLFYGFALLLFDVLPHLDNYTETPVTMQIVNVSGYVFIMYCFIDILGKIRIDKQTRNGIFLVFVSTIILQFVSILAFNLKVLSFLPSVFKSGVFVMDSNFQRYNGLFGDYELIVDYCMVVIAFSLILINNDFKILPIVTFLLAIFVGFASGTRSFLIILLIFFSVFYFSKIIILKEGGKFIITIISIMFFLLFTFIIWEDKLVYFFSQLSIVQRGLETLSLLRTTSNFDTLANRDYVDAFKLIFTNLNPLGYGPFEFNVVLGNGMFSHNVFFAAYVKYGIIGVFLLFFVFYKSVKFLIHEINLKYNRIYTYESIVFLALVISLFFQEIKISALRTVNSMLIYLLLFVIIFNQKNEHQLKQNTF